jgi:hypothetical protein
LAATRFVKLAMIVVPVVLGAGGLYRLLAPHGPPGKARAPEAQAGAVARPSEPRGARSHSREAQKRLLGTLLSEPNLALKLSNSLAAIEADPTPPEQDPLWPVLTEYLANLWTPETAPNAMDLMFAEQRPRARRALISSFALLATSERFQTLPAAQRQKLTNYFIDMYDGVVAAQKPEVERALRTTAGNDVADILLRKGLGSADHQLESEREYDQGLAQAQQLAAKAPP